MRTISQKLKGIMLDSTSSANEELLCAIKHASQSNSNGFHTGLSMAAPHRTVHYNKLV
jgi:hypothetical protein